jgi:ketosteroid isomerase-like protein
MEAGGSEMLMRRGIDENARLMRRGYEAFSAGDMDTLRELFAEDVVWHVPGHNRLSGDKRGRDAVFEYFGELVSGSGGTFKVTLHDVIAGEDHVIGLHHNGAEHDGKVLDLNVVLIFHMSGGRFRESWEVNDNEVEWDAFWS